MAKIKVSRALLSELLFPGAVVGISRDIKVDERGDVVFEIEGNDVPMTNGEIRATVIKGEDAVEFEAV